MTVADIRDNITAQIRASMGITAPLLPKSFISILSAAVAAVYVLLDQYAQWMARQLFVSTQSYVPSEILGKLISPLIESGRQIGIGDPTPATQAELVVSMDVVTQGYTVPAGELLVSSLNGITYATLTAIYLNASTMSVTVRAIGDQSGGNGAGSVGNLNAGAVLTFVRTVPGVRQEATVTSQAVTGADAETEIAYRERVTDRWARRPQGGALADYEQWAETVPGIIHAYPYSGTNPGEVKIYCEASDQPDGIPTTAQLEAVEKAVELDESGIASRRPIGAAVDAVAITRTAFDVTVHGLSVDNEAEVRQQITDAVTELLLTYAPFISGLTTPPRADRISRASIEGAVLGVVNAAGGVFSSLDVTTGGSAVTIYTLGQGEKAKAGGVAFAP